MRLTSLLAAAILLVPGAAGAQAWVNYINKDLAFSINFPSDPKIEKIAYKTRSGATVPAQTFSAARDGSTYVLTVADFSGKPWEENGIIAYVAANLRKMGTPRYDEYAQLDGIPGHQLGMVRKDGGHVQASVYIYNHLLYIAVGDAPPDAPPPSGFQQTIAINEPDGRPINLNRGVPREQQAGAAQRAITAAANAQVDANGNPVTPPARTAAPARP